MGCLWLFYTGLFRHLAPTIQTCDPLIKIGYLSFGAIIICERPINQSFDYLLKGDSPPLPPKRMQAFPHSFSSFDVYEKSVFLDMNASPTITLQFKLNFLDFSLPSF